MTAQNSITVTVTIDRPIAEVFAFAIDPANTPKWVDAIVTEEANEWPVKVGTIYRNQRANGEWLEYTVTEFEQNKKFVIRQNTDDFTVDYTFSPTGTDATELQYSIYKESGTLPASLTTGLLDTILTKLKHVIEQS